MLGIESRVIGLQPTLGMNLKKLKNIAPGIKIAAESFITAKDN